MKTIVIDDNQITKNRYKIKKNQLYQTTIC